MPSEPAVLLACVKDWLSHNRWALHQRCYLTDFYNASACTYAYGKLPACLEATQMAFMDDTVERRAAALHACFIVYPDVEGRDTQNVERKVRFGFLAWEWLC